MIRKQAQKSSLVDALLKTSDKKSNYRKEVNDRQPEMKQAKKIEKDRSWANQETRVTEYNNPITRGVSSVRPSRCASKGGITDMGGPTKQIGCESNNSVWDSNVLGKRAESISSKEATVEEKASSDRIRQKKQAEYKQSMSPKLGEDADALAQKSSSVNSTYAKSSGKGWVPSNKISMFDNNLNFDRLTAIENRVSPKIEKQEAKKASHIGNKKVASSKDMTNRFVDGIVDQKKDSSYKSVHDDTTSRLFKVLSERNKE